MFRRTQFFIVAIVLLLVASLLATACGSQPAAPAAKPADTAPQKAAQAEAPAKTVTVRLGHNITWSNPALIVGLYRGTFKKPGLEVTSQDFAAPTQVQEAMVAGDLDVGVSTVSNYLTGLEQGMKMRAVAITQGASDPPISYFTRKDGGVKTVADLKGKKAGVNNYGGNYDLYLRYMLAKNGLDPKKDVEILTMPVPAIPAAIANGQIDLGPMALLGMATAMKQYGDKLSVLFDYRDVNPEKAREANVMILVMTDKFLNENRAGAKVFLKAYLEAVRWLNANTKEGLETWAKATKQDALATLKAPPIMPNDARLYPAAFQFDADLALQFGYLKNKANAQQVIDHTLLDEILAEEGKR